MAARFNPLLDDKRPEQTQKTVTAADDPPPSPFGGAPMTRAMCRNTPVYVDVINRVVVPIKRRY